MCFCTDRPRKVGSTTVASVAGLKLSMEALALMGAVGDEQGALLALHLLSLTLAGQTHQQLLPTWKECKTYLSAIASWSKMCIGALTALDAASTEAAAEGTPVATAAATAVTSAAAAAATETKGSERPSSTATAATSTRRNEGKAGSNKVRSAVSLGLTWLLEGLFDVTPGSGASDEPSELNLQEFTFRSAGASHATLLLLLVLLARVELVAMNQHLGVLPRKPKSSRISTCTTKVPAAACSSSGCDQGHNRRRSGEAISSSGAAYNSSIGNAESLTQEGGRNGEGGCSGKGWDAGGGNCSTT